MPIAESFGRYCPFLLESDFISLSKPARVDNGLLVDAALGATHTIREPGQYILGALEDGTTVGNLECAGRMLKLDHGQIAELLGFLNLAGLLRRKRRPGHWATALLQQAWGICVGMHYAPLTRREHATSEALLRAIMRACVPLIVAIGCTGILIIATGISVISTVLLALHACVLFLCSLFIHEMLHIRVINRCGYDAVVLQRGLRLGILHTPLKPRDEIRCSLLGPAGGCLVGCMGMLAAAIAGSTAGLILAGVVVVIHILSLLPWYGDGASIRSALGEKDRA